MTANGQDETWVAWCNRPAHLKHLSLEEYKTQTTARATVVGQMVVTATPGNQRAQHEPGRMNGLEKKYAQHLELRKTTGEIVDWRFEPMKLRLAPATFYSPDFLLLFHELDGRTWCELHETKGHWEDDARVKVKVAATMFPWFKFVGVQWSKDAKDWKFEVFKA